MNSRTVVVGEKTALFSAATSAEFFFPRDVTGGKFDKIISLSFDAQAFMTLSHLNYYTL